MDQGNSTSSSNALNKLLESADLIKMLEDLTSPGTLSGSSIAGLRLTLKNVREAVLASHDALAENVVSRAKSAVSAENAATEAARTQAARPDSSESALKTEIITGARSPIISDSQRIQMTRRDLRASLEKMVDR